MALMLAGGVVTCGYGRHGAIPRRDHVLTPAPVSGAADRNTTFTSLEASSSSAKRETGRSGLVDHPAGELGTATPPTPANQDYVGAQQFARLAAGCLPTSRARSRSDFWAPSRACSPHGGARNIRGQKWLSGGSGKRCLGNRVDGSNGVGTGSRVCAVTDELRIQAEYPFPEFSTSAHSALLASAYPLTSARRRRH